jgi:hypothetical protein
MFLIFVNLYVMKFQLKCNEKYAMDTILDIHEITDFQSNPLRFVKLKPCTHQSGHETVTPVVCAIPWRLVESHTPEQTVICDTETSTSIPTINVNMDMTRLMLKNHCIQNIDFLPMIQH